MFVKFSFVDRTVFRSLSTGNFEELSFDLRFFAFVQYRTKMRSSFSHNFFLCQIESLLHFAESNQLQTCRNFSEFSASTRDLG